MSDGGDKLVSLLALGLLAYGAWWLLEGGGDDGGDGGDQSLPMDASGGAGGVMDASSVYDLARSMLQSMGIADISPAMVVGISSVETGGKFNPDAVRQEPRLNDASYGLMQVLGKTAAWLATLGYTAYDPGPDSLLTPQGSLYFGCAYLHWLRNYHGGPNADEWVVAAYNGGPGGASGPGPQKYLAAYQDALSGLGFA